MELGSEFHVDFENLIEVKDTIFDYLKEFHAIYVTNGRAALRMATSVLKSGTILMPEYICESVIEAFDERFQIRYYEVDEKLNISMESLKLNMDENVSAVYLMHYFGQLQNQEVLNYIKGQRNIYKYKIIEDTTHSIFTEQCTIGDYCICSIRKWFPVPDGGVLYSRDNMEKIESISLNKQTSIPKLEAMILKKYFLEYQINVNTIYREIFMREEEKLNDTVELKEISDISRSLLECYSITDMKRKRKENYNKLIANKNSIYAEVLSEEIEFTPFMFPIYKKKRDVFRQYLMENKIYCAIHWPYLASFKGKKSEYISEHILSLPIDQRYNWECMEYIVNVINRFDEESCNGMYSS